MLDNYSTKKKRVCYFINKIRQKVCKGIKDVLL